MTLTSMPRMLLMGTLGLVAGCTSTSSDLLVDLETHAFGPFDWTAPMDLGPDVNASNGELSPALSFDGLSLYFSSNRAGGEGGFDIWVSRRSSVCDPFGPAANLGPTINSADREQGAFVSRDGHQLFFIRGNQALTSGDILVSRRTQTHDDFAWGPPVALGPEVNTPELETEPWLVLAGGDDDGGAGYLYFGRGPTNTTQDFYVAPVTRDGVPLAPAVPVSELNSPTAPPLGNEDGIAVRGDSREAIFTSRRFPTGGAELFVSRRANPNDPWGPPQLLTDLNSSRPDVHPALSHDGRTLVWSSARSGPGEFRLYMSTRTPGGQTDAARCGRG